MEREGLLERAVHIGKQLEATLQSLASDGIIHHARGAVAVWAAAHQPGIDAFAVRDAMLKRGAITRAVSADTNSFCPPLVITDKELTTLLDIFAATTMEFVQQKN
jgi:adenosylmethionine-8-amino-7-oxononanoate aminotransferase